MMMKQAIVIVLVAVICCQHVSVAQFPFGQIPMMPQMPQMGQMGQMGMNPMAGMMGMPQMGMPQMGMMGQMPPAMPAMNMGMNMNMMGQMNPMGIPFQPQQQQQQQQQQQAKQVQVQASVPVNNAAVPQQQQQQQQQPTMQSMQMPQQGAADITKWAEMMGMPKMSDQEAQHIMDIQQSIMGKLQSLHPNDLQSMRVQQNQLASDMDNILSRPTDDAIGAFQSKQEQLMNAWGAKLGLPAVTPQEHEMMRGQLHKMFDQLSKLPQKDLEALRQKHQEIGAKFQ